MKLLSLFFHIVFLTAQGVVFEGVSAIVGNTVILKSDVSQLVSMTALQQKIDLNKNPELSSLLQNQVLQELINQRVILEMAKIDSVEVKEKDVDVALDKQIDNIISQAGSREIAEEYLGQSLKSFRREFWGDMQDRIITEQYQFSLLNKININRDEVVKFYEEYEDSLGFLPTLYRINHNQLPISPSDDSVSDAFAHITEIRQKILSGESFHSMATAHSEDTGSASQGGELGYVQRGSLVTEFESVAFTQEIKSLSKPVLTEFGFHIIETLDRRGEKAKIRHILIKPKISESDETRAYQLTLAVKDSITDFESFKHYAKKYSDDKSTKKIGGDLGWVDLSRFPIPEFSQAIQTMSSINSCSLPLKTSAGYHLLWVSAIRPGGKPTLKDHWTEIESMALNHKKALWFQDWIEKAKSVLFISVY
jgi:peptidyl-prolyl cis-trans isomerase SurA